MENIYNKNENEKFRTAKDEEDNEDEEYEKDELNILESTLLPTTSDENDEEGAIFRSIDVMSASSAISTMNVFDAPSLTQSSPLLMPPSFTTQGMTSGLFPATSGHSLVERSNWKVSSNVRLPNIPLCYPLERTHVIIPLDEMNVQVLTALISNLAQRLSLACSYETDSQAYLTAEDGTLLSVQLFLDEDDFGDDSTILEIQRRSGRTETFYFLANKLLQVSKGVEHVEKMDLTSGKPQVPVTSIDDVPDDLVDVLKSSDEEEIEYATSTLVMATGLLHSEKSDSQELGMKLLEALTDSNRSSRTSCRHASHKIVTSETFGSLLKDFMYQEFSDCSTVYDDDLVRSYKDTLKKHALQILANSLSVCVNEAVIINNGWLDAARSDIVSKLVEIVSMARVRPHEALLSMRCLEAILLLFPEAREQAMNLDLAQIVVRAKLVGECYHANLFQESERLVNRMTDSGLISA